MLCKITIVVIKQKRFYEMISVEEATAQTINASASDLMGGYSLNFWKTLQFLIKKNNCNIGKCCKTFTKNELCLV